jgi:F-type H+-transporting ATPase subunit b
MPRHPILALGLVALILSIGPRVPASAADEPAKAAGEHAPHEADAHAGGHAEGGGSKPNILEPQPSLAIWTVVVFLGLLLVLRRFAWGPLSEALHKREEHLEHVLLETERARNESEKLLAEHRRRLDQATNEIRSLLDEARREAQTNKDEIARVAHAEAEATKQRAERDIATARDQALNEIWNKAADLAVTVAGRVLSKNLTPEDHRRLVDSAIGELPAAPSTTNGQQGARA